MIETEVKKKITVEEFMLLREENIELLNGQIVEEPTPTYWHQKLSIILANEIFNKLKENHRGEILTAPLSVRLGEHVVQPDLLFISNENRNIIQDGEIAGAPDVVFEIISPSNAFNDTKLKFDIYEQFGVKEYFIVYPEDGQVVKYQLQNGKFREQYRETALIKSDIIACEINF